MFDFSHVCVCVCKCTKTMVPLCRARRCVYGFGVVAIMEAGQNVLVFVCVSV